MTEKDRERKESTFCYFAGKIRQEERQFDDMDVLTLGALDMLRDDPPLGAEGGKIDELKANLIATRDCFIRAVQAVEEACEGREDFWKHYIAEDEQ